ncbi:hypothetical protein GFO_1237 [Christiangramia forsetii KT0803]|uniref:Uncharacterized protein n=1 Tax=Christiangramia forsetii (strain DSM 17595 / CGMCC 1.15422 / KT0803) TaxID=411154 RepID=A0M0R6_CHRFK|nr:hypothetical protein GFO_1237 [Christiangramia forsetii KT0803]
MMAINVAKMLILNLGLLILNKFKYVLNMIVNIEKSPLLKMKKETLLF